MRLLKVDSLDEARNKLVQAAACITPKICSKPLQDAFGMILAEDLMASESIPNARTRSSSSGIRLAPSRREYSLWVWR